MKFKGFMKRHKNRIMCIVSAFVLFCGFVFSSPLKANATQVQQTGNVFYVNYARPMVGDNMGYLNVVLANGTLITYMWNINAYTPEGTLCPATCEIYIDHNFISFYVGASKPCEEFTLTVYSFSKYGCQFLIDNVSSAPIGREFNSRIVGWKSYGDGLVSSFIENDSIFTVCYADDGSSLLLMEVIDILQGLEGPNIDIYNTVNSILNSVDGLENQLTSVINYLKSVDDKLPDIQDKLQNIYDKLDEILEEEKKQTSWLEKIWNSIQEFFNPDEEQQEQTDAIKDKTNEQSNELNDLTEQSKTEQVDIGQASATVDSAVDATAMTNYGVMLQIFTNNDYIFKCLLLTITISLVAFVIFGKR